MPIRRVPYSVSFLIAATAEFVSDYITKKKPIATKEGVRLAGSGTCFENDMTRQKLGLVEYSTKNAINGSADWLIKEGFVNK